MASCRYFSGNNNFLYHLQKTFISNLSQQTDNWRSQFVLGQNTNGTLTFICRQETQRGVSTLQNGVYSRITVDYKIKNFQQINAHEYKSQFSCLMYEYNSPTVLCHLLINHQLIRKQHGSSQAAINEEIITKISQKYWKLMHLQTAHNATSTNDSSE